MKVVNEAAKTVNFAAAVLMILGNIFFARRGIYFFFFLFFFFFFSFLFSAFHAFQQKWHALVLFTLLVKTYRKVFVPIHRSSCSKVPTNRLLTVVVVLVVSVVNETFLTLQVYTQAR